MEKNEFPFPPKHDPAHESPPMLINEISRIFAARMREGDSEMQQASVRLIIICLSREDGLTQLEISKRTHLKPPTISVTLKALEAKHLISRQQDGDDMRAIRVYLTEKGRQLNEQTLCRLHALDEVLMREITPEESDILLSLLRRMRKNLIDNMSATDQQGGSNAE